MGEKGEEEQSPSLISLPLYRAESENQALSRVSLRQMRLSNFDTKKHVS
jgi:hypothetical protein